ncbi:hypothetical protein P280DRAFT_468764 [Massarina eburnea CBS 473.64]|uniref:Uncharacterized protein n=1 Tax=Massarina eburnea CBS 473.64 TaxID=1395130 RepID=A0A6A6S0J0_9PLEO|nr:hypothetical protein P280DRAFT_468764 [Massarina eburnea CBS 473.64]
MSRALSKKEAQQQQIQQQQQHARDVETDEHHASANASGGLNLNLVGALSGAFSSKQKKTTHTNPDGSSDSVEDRRDKGAANAVAQGNGTAHAAANAQEGSRHHKGLERGQQAQQGKFVKGKKGEGMEVDHLGIEA